MATNDQLEVGNETELALRTPENGGEWGRDVSEFRQTEACFVLYFKTRYENQQLGMNVDWACAAGSPGPGKSEARGGEAAGMP